MGHCNTAGLLGVIIEVSLCVHIGIIADDLDRVLVCTYSTVGTKTPELTVYSSFRSGNKRCAKLQGKVGNIIYDTDGELFLGCVLIYSYDLSRCGILGTKAITSGKDRCVVELSALQSCYYIKVQRLAESSRLLCSVKNSNLLYSLRNRGYQCLCAERTIQTYLYDADLLACCKQVIDRLLDRITIEYSIGDHTAV